MSGRHAALLVLALTLAGCTEALRWEHPDRRPPRTWPDAIEPGPEPGNDRVAGPDEYVVRAGDTVYSIAFRHQLDFRELADWNGVGDDYLIRPGEVLTLRARAPRSPATETSVIETRPLAPPPAPVMRPLEQRAELAWRWPTRGEVLRAFDPRGGAKGLDIGGAVGQRVVAAAPGKVVYSGSALKGYGELVIIQHDDVYLSAYGYNRRRLMKEGELVAADQPIAELGLGPEQKPLLHFEIRERGRPINPQTLLPVRN